MEHRQRWGHKRSKPEHNNDGRSEAELKRLSLEEKAPCRNFKKRHLKDLSEAEVDEIVTTSMKPGWLKKDIAKKFRVSDMLISRICKEAEK